MTKRKSAVIAGGVLLVLALIPIPYRASPDWKVWVVDSTGNPAGGVTVQLSYQNYSVESDGHEEERLTDEHGYTHFDEHRLAASLLQRCWYSVMSARALAHASFGPHDWVFAFGNGLQGEAVSDGIVTDWTGTPAQMESQIVLKAVPK
jgi:hypothetical protein